MIWLALAAVLSQVPVVSQFDDGVIVGRVCEDLDGDERCGSEEPGVEAARVLLETGLEAVADRDGRFHFAAVAGRTADVYAGGRLTPGRHRAKVDRGSLLGSWAGVEKGRTVELSAGSAVFIDFPLRRGESAVPGLAEESAALRKEAGVLEYELSLTVPEGELATIEGRPAPQGRQWARLSPGHNRIPVALQRPGQLRLWIFALDVVRREGSTLIIPRGLTPLGTVSWSVAGVLSAELPADLQLTVEGEPLLRDETGRGARSLTGDEVELSFGQNALRWTQSLRRLGAAGVFVVGLLDVEANFDSRGGFQVFGRGAAAARASFAGFKLGVELDLRDVDLRGNDGALPFTPRTLLDARKVEVFGRQLDPMRNQLAFADDSATVASNPSEGRFRLELSREGWGRLGYGSARWFQAAADAGRAHRAVQGAFLELKTPTEKTAFGVELKALAAPSQGDVLSGLTRRPMHERFESTGGSLFFLAKSSVVEGSEVLRVEWRDAVTQLPLREVHLQRLRDYTIDFFSGRVLLARPLSFFASESLLQTDPLTAGVVAVLVVDYEYLESGIDSDVVLGAELKARLGPVKLTGSGLRDGNYGLLRAAAEAKLGPVWLSAEGARSFGAVQGLAFSRDGLKSEIATPSAADSAGWAVTLRARAKGLFGRGSWDAAWRWRESGFEDAAQRGALQQVSLRGEQPLGPIVVAVLADYRELPDPRDPFSVAWIRARTLGGGVGYEQPGWGIRLEAREFQQTISGDTKGGFTLGLAARYRLTPWLQLRAGYRQQLIPLGGMELSFASLGVDLKPSEKLELGLRGGWGPVLGPQVWGTVSYSTGNETWYGVQAIDADAPGAGERRLVTGVRQQIDPTTAVFVEDVSATDVDGLRLARAVGLTQKVDDAFTVTARYEHGARALDGLAPDVSRNAGGLTLAYERDALRFFARGEVRDEQGARTLRQFVASGGGEWRVHRDVSITARALWTHSTKEGQMVGRTVDATGAIAWRLGRGALLARYAYQQSWTPALDSRLHVVSLLPTIRISDRFAIGAGAHLGLTSAGLILAGSVRPSVRIWEGLEIAGEAAARSLAPDGGSWASLRAEVGYRFDHRFFVGAGYNAFGFSGTGLDMGATSSRDRVYLRTEISY